MPKKGYKQTEEHKRKGAEARRGAKKSDQEKRRISDALKSRWQDPEYRAQMCAMSQRLWGSAEGREAIRERTARWWSEPGRKMPKPKPPTDEEVRAKIGAATRERFKDEEYRERHRETMRVAMSRPEAKERMSAAQRERFTKSEERAKIGRATSQRCMDPEYVRELVRRMGRGNHSPNKVETAMARILEEVCPGRYAYTGNGAVFIGGKKPDFTDDQGTVIEVYGDYWHRGEDPQERIDFFFAQGYRCLVVWECQIINDPEAVKRLVVEFTQGDESMTPKYPDVVVNFTRMPPGSLFESLKLFRDAAIACRDAGHSIKEFCDSSPASIDFDATREYVSRWVTLTVSAT